MKKKKLKHLNLNKFKIAQINNNSVHKGGKEIFADSVTVCTVNNACGGTVGQECNTNGFCDMSDKVGTCESDQFHLCVTDRNIACGG